VRHLVTALVLISAGIFYSIGFDGGAIAAIIVAVGLEILFWARIVRFAKPLRTR